MDDKSIQGKFALLIRISHWINFPVMMLMIWSGFLIYWANPAYWPNLPESFYDSLHMNARLAEGMAFHFTLMWFFAFNGLIYIAYILFSGEWRELVPRLHDFRDALSVTLHDLGLRKNLPPQGKLNAAQRIAYTGVLLMGLGSIVTGIAIYKPVQATWIKGLVGGYETARFLHYLLAVTYILFFFLHVGQVIRAGWNHFRAMITGYEVVDGAEHSDEKNRP